MVTPLCDASGNPYIDGNGHFVLVSGLTEIRQRVDNLFGTIKNTELFFPDYGIDYSSIMREGGNNINEVFYLRVVEGLYNSPLIDVVDIKNVVAYVSGTTGLVTFSTLSKDGTTSNHFISNTMGA